MQTRQYNHKFPGSSSVSGDFVINVIVLTLDLRELGMGIFCKWRSECRLIRLIELQLAFQYPHLYFGRPIPLTNIRLVCELIFSKATVRPVDLGRKTAVVPSFSLMTWNSSSIFLHL